MSVRTFLVSAIPPFLQPYWRRIQASPLGYRLMQGAFWSLVGAIISRGLALAASILVARMLGKETYGELGIIRSTIGVFGTLAGFGLGTTATKYVAEFRDRDPAKAGRVMALSRVVALATGGLMAGVLAILAPWLATHTLAAPHLVGMLRASALLLLFSALNGAESGALAGFEAFRAIATRSLWAGLANFPLMLSGVHFFGLAGAVWALVLGMVLNWGLNYLAAQKAARRAQVAHTFRDCWTESRVLWEFSLPAALSGAMVAPTTWLCNAMLVNQRNGYAEMGSFSAALQFQTMMTFVGSTLSQPLLSMITNQRGTEQGRLSRVNILATWAIGVLPALPMLAFPEIAEWLFGEGYSGTSFRWTVLATVLATSVVIYKQGLARALTSRGLMWWGLLSNGVWGILLLGSTCVLVRYGAVGLAVSYAIAYALDTIVFIPFYLNRKLIPDGTLVSTEAAMIWISLLALTVLSFFGMPPVLRSVALLVSTGLVLYAFRRMISSVGAHR